MNLYKGNTLQYLQEGGRFIVGYFYENLNGQKDTSKTHFSKKEGFRFENNEFAFDKKSIKVPIRFFFVDLTSKNPYFCSLFFHLELNIFSHLNRL